MSKIISLREFKRIALEVLAQCGISISELARITGIKQPTLHKGLYGDRELTFSNAALISKALDLNLFNKISCDNKELVPVINDFAQLYHFNDNNFQVWDDFVAISSVVNRSCIVFDSRLFDLKLAPKKSLFIVDFRSEHDGNAVFCKNGRLFLDMQGGSRLGSLLGIMMRKTN